MPNLEAPTLTNPNPVPRMLADARRGLLADRDRLAMHRRLGQLNQNDRDLLQHAEEDFLASLDRVWAVQCMFSAAL